MQWLLLPSVKFPVAVVTIFMCIFSLPVPQSTTKHFVLYSGVQVTTALVPWCLTWIWPGKSVNRYTIRDQQIGKQFSPFLLAFSFAVAQRLFIKELLLQVTSI